MREENGLGLCGATRVAGALSKRRSRSPRGNPRGTEGRPEDEGKKRGGHSGVAMPLIRGHGSALRQ
jgi:hypothetical protein